jgi:O-methyltransferase
MGQWLELARMKLLNKLEVVLARPDHHYVSNVYGRSAYKLRDIREIQPFERVAIEAIGTGRCMLYYDRLYTVYQAVQNAARLANGSFHFLEVGVYRGGTTYFIMRLAQELGIKVTGQGFDTFEGHAPIDLVRKRDLHAAGNFSDTSYEQVSSFLARFQRVELLKGRVQDTINQVNEVPWLIHLDTDIYEPTLFTLRHFAKQLPLGAMVVVDDFDFTSCPGIRLAVEEFLAETSGYSAMALLTGQCVLTRVG